MNRRTFFSRTLGVLAAIAVPSLVRATEPDIETGVRAEPWDIGSDQWDDAPRIQAAIDAAYLERRRFVLPPGVYHLPNTPVNLRGHVRVYGSTFVTPLGFHAFAGADNAAEDSCLIAYSVFVDPEHQHATAFSRIRLP